MCKGACYGNFLAFTVAVAVVLAGLCGCAVGHAEVRVGEVDAPFELSPSFQAAGSASIKQELSDGGESCWLLLTFDDLRYAVELVSMEMTVPPWSSM